MAATSVASRSLGGVTKPAATLETTLSAASANSRGIPRDARLRKLGRSVRGICHTRLSAFCVAFVIAIPASSDATRADRPARPGCPTANGPAAVPPGAGSDRGSR